ncbi:retrotransposon protein, putative, unclassified [Tanacetum coccineum]
METMNVQFDELTQMAFEQLGSGPDLHGLTSGHINVAEFDSDTFTNPFAPPDTSSAKSSSRIKALYGLKQAPRSWYDLLSKFLLSQKFVKGIVDLTLFTRKEGNDLILYGLDQCDAIDIPMVGQSKLDEDPNGTLVDLTSYRGMPDAPTRCLYRPHGVAQYQEKILPKKHLITVKDRLSKVPKRRNLKVAKIQGKLTDYGFNFYKNPLYSNSKSAIALSCNTLQHSRTKHIAVRYHFIKEQVENKVVELYFVKTDYQLSDIFTKALTRERF